MFLQYTFVNLKKVVEGGQMSTYAPLKTGVNEFSCTALDWIVEIPVKYLSPAVHWISMWGRDSVILSSVDMRYLMKAGSSKYLDVYLLAMF